MNEPACTATICNPRGVMCADFDTCQRVKIYGATMEVPGEAEPQRAPTWQIFGFGLLIGFAVGLLTFMLGQAWQRGLLL